MTTAPFDGRATWTSKPPAHPLNPWGPGEPEGVDYHYIGGTGGPFSPKSHSDCLAWAAATEAREEAGTVGTHDVYSALSYNALACTHGRVIEGRGIGYQSGAQLGGNDKHVAVLIMVNVGQPMTDGLKLAGAAARDMVLARYPRAVRVLGHRDDANNPTGTACPGDIVEAWLRAGAHPPTSVTPTEDDMQFAIVYPETHLPVGPKKGDQPTCLGIVGTPLLWVLDAVTRDALTPQYGAPVKLPLALWLHNGVDPHVYTNFA